VARGQWPMGVGAYTRADQPAVQADDGWIRPPEDNPPPSRPPEPSHRRRNLVMVLAIVIAVALVVLVVAPLPHPFSQQFEGRSSPMSPPSGSRVSGSWETLDGSSVGFLIILNLTSYEPAYSSYGRSGTFSFTATGLSLIFEQAVMPCPSECAPSPILASGYSWYPPIL